MPFIKYPHFTSQQTTLHLTSRNEQRKIMQPKEPSGSLFTLLFQTVLFLGFLGGSVALFCSLFHRGSEGSVFLTFFLLLLALKTLFWLIPNYKAWKRKKKS